MHHGLAAESAAQLARCTGARRHLAAGPRQQLCTGGANKQRWVAELGPHIWVHQSIGPACLMSNALLQLGFYQWQSCAGARGKVRWRRQECTAGASSTTGEAGSALLQVPICGTGSFRPVAQRSVAVRLGQEQCGPTKSIAVADDRDTPTDALLSAISLVGVRGAAAVARSPAP